MSAQRPETAAETAATPEVQHAQTYSGHAACSRRKASDRIVLVPVDLRRLCPKCKELMESDRRV